MTVSQLKESLNDAPDDMIVYIPLAINPNMGFTFGEACPAITGVVEFGPPEPIYDKDGTTPIDQDQVRSGFVIFSHEYHQEDETIVDETLN